MAERDRGREGERVEDRGGRDIGGEKHREGGRERVKVGYQNHNNINRPRYCRT